MTTSSVRPKIMVVDDTPLNLNLMDSILGADYSVQLVSSGAKAIELATAAAPDLILLDVMMPEMDGFEVCRRLKANPATGHVPVIFVTAKREIADEKLGFEVGASDFIHKPVSAPIVAARVRTHLKIKFMQDYLQNENLRLQENAEQNSSELEQLKGFIWGAPNFARR
ncbi:MAG TPA: response regulator [Gallionella sp.]|nr:response regulator [Gallionella sp.]